MFYDDYNDYNDYSYYEGNEDYERYYEESIQDADLPEEEVDEENHYSDDPATCDPGRYVEVDENGNTYIHPPRMEKEENKVSVDKMAMLRLFADLNDLKRRVTALVSKLDSIYFDRPERVLYDPDDYLKQYGAKK